MQVELSLEFLCCHLVSVTTFGGIHDSYTRILDTTRGYAKPQEKHDEMSEHKT